MHVLLINAFESASWNCFIFSELIDINKNIRKSLESTCSEKLDWSRKQNKLKKSFVGTYKKKTGPRRFRFFKQKIWFLWNCEPWSKTVLQYFSLLNQYNQINETDHSIVLKSKINLNLSQYLNKMILYRLYLGHAKNFNFESKNLKVMNLGLGSKT